ncbi:hypothetical protein DPSP01_014071 [Paraphaeosphaeria sporulosa]
MLHPVNKNTFRFPHCDIRICLEFQELLVSTVSRPRKQAIDLEHLHVQELDETASEWMNAARCVWRHARLTLAHAVLHHERIADLEVQCLESGEATAWSKEMLQHCFNTSASAVRYANANTKYQAVIMDTQVGEDVSAVKPPEAKEKKCVTFAADVEERFEPRTCYMFDRNGSHYFPGKYAPESKSAYINTSGYELDMASIQQLKIYVIKHGPGLVSPHKYEEGLVGLHPLWPQLRDSMKAEKDGEMDEDKDGIVVHHNNM